jgi:hypothetical protein
MNNGQLYLAWLRTVAPSLYSQAVRKATGKQHTLGGLTDNLLNRALSPGLTQSFLGDDELDDIDVTAVSMDQPVTTDLFIAPVDTTFDTSTVAAPSAVSVAPLPNVPATTTAAAAPSSNIFANILTAVASIGSTVVTASQQSALIALNTQRAAQGLPPVNAAGQVVTAAGTATTSPALLAFENAITGGAGGSLLPIILIGGVLAYFLFGRKSAV